MAAEEEAHRSGCCQQPPQERESQRRAVLVLYEGGPDERPGQLLPVRNSDAARLVPSTASPRASTAA